MSYLTDLVEGFAQLLAAGNLGLVWSPSGVYTDGLDYGQGPYGSGDFGTGGTAIVVMAIPQSPSRLVSLTPYLLGDNPTLSDSDAGLQIRSRSAAADPRDVFDLDDSIADFLLGNFPLLLPTGISVSTLVRSSAVSLGQDDSKRWEWSSNYALQLHRPSLHRV